MVEFKEELFTENVPLQEDRFMSFSLTAEIITPALVKVIGEYGKA